MNNKILLLLLVSFFSLLGYGQRKLTKTSISGDRQTSRDDSLSNNLSSGFKDVASIDMYLLFNKEVDSMIVDTTISIQKDYKFNYLQKDNFGLMPFANMGQTYNSLTLNFENNSTVPLFGARARHFNYYTEEDVFFYEVPTPWTRLTYKTAFEQGQMLDAFFTVNLSKQFNFSIAYKGLRSLGNYQNALTSTGNFRFTTNYKTKNNRYSARAFVVMQDLLNQENGGLRDEDIENFTSGDEEFIDRSVFDPNFENAENILEGRNYYLDHSYEIIKRKDSLNNNSLSVYNKIVYEDKYFQYYQDTPAVDFFGDIFTNNIDDKVKLEDFKTEAGVNFYNNILGNISFGLSYTNINYGYNGVVLLDGDYIPNRIKSDFLGVRANYAKRIGKFNLEGSGSLNLSDEFSGSYLDGKIDFQFNKDIDVFGGINVSSQLPNYNFLLYQSDYINYNWYNLDNYSNVNTQQISFGIKSQKYLNAFVDISNIDNYTFFNLENIIDGNRVIQPEQYNGSIQYLRLKAEKEFRVGNFALDNTIMYQNVISDQDVLNVPAFITRNTLYYSNQLFKKAMTLQTGVTLNYFTEYNMNGYDPLLAEFYTQNETKIGGFPMLDFFINAKIRQTRIFLKAEHFNSSFTGYDFFSAPGHPFRDFTVRFGLVWDFFL